MYKRVICAASIFAVLFCSCFTSFAHPGRTDSKGGHYDRSTGEYHYHHGYPEHQHTNGVCPYNFEDKTGQSTGKSSSQSAKKQQEVKSETVETNIPWSYNKILYCISTILRHSISYLIAIFFARFAKPREWAWMWFGLAAFTSALVLYNDYNNKENTELFTFTVMSALLISVISIFLILKMYKLREEKGLDRKVNDRSKSTEQKKKETKVFSISEQEYQRAMRIISMSVHSKEIKELSRAMGKTPQETINHFTEVVRNYNLERYSKNGEGR